MLNCQATISRGATHTCVKSEPSGALRIAAGAPELKGLIISYKEDLAPRGGSPRHAGRLLRASLSSMEPLRGEVQQARLQQASLLQVVLGRSARGLPHTSPRTAEELCSCSVCMCQAHGNHPSSRVGAAAVSSSLLASTLSAAVGTNTGTYSKYHLQHSLEHFCKWH